MIIRKMIAGGGNGTEANVGIGGGIDAKGKNGGGIAPACAGTKQGINKVFASKHAEINEGISKTEGYEKDEMKLLREFVINGYLLAKNKKIMIVDSENIAKDIHIEAIRIYGIGWRVELAKYAKQNIGAIKEMTEEKEAEDEKKALNRDLQREKYGKKAIYEFERFVSNIGSKSYIFSIKAMKDKKLMRNVIMAGWKDYASFLPDAIKMLVEAGKIGKEMQIGYDVPKEHKTYKKPLKPKEDEKIESPKIGEYPYYSEYYPEKIMAPALPLFAKEYILLIERTEEYARIPTATKFKRSHSELYKKIKEHGDGKTPGYNSFKRLLIASGELPKFDVRCSICYFPKEENADGPDETQKVPILAFEKYDPKRENELKKMILLINSTISELAKKEELDAKEENRMPRQISLEDAMKADGDIEKYAQDFPGGQEMFAERFSYEKFKEIRNNMLERERNKIIELAEVRGADPSILLMDQKPAVTKNMLMDDRYASKYLKTHGGYGTVMGRILQEKEELWKYKKENLRNNGIII